MRKSSEILYLAAVTMQQHKKENAYYKNQKIKNFRLFLDIIPKICLKLF